MRVPEGLMPRGLGALSALLTLAHAAPLQAANADSDGLSPTLQDTAVRRVPRTATDLDALGTRRTWIAQTLVSTGDGFRVPTEADGELFEMATHLDSLLKETAMDLGLMPVPRRGVLRPHSDANALIELAKDQWVLAPRLAERSGRITLTLRAITPGSKVLMTRQEPVTAHNLDLRAIILARDLVRAAMPPDCADANGHPGSTTQAQVPDSKGTAVLGLSGAAYGGYIGFTLQRAGGSSDTRLTYPLVALGAGVGLGSALLVAEEWEIGVGDAWFVSAALWWPTVSGLLLADGYGVDDQGDRFAYGLLGGGLGLSLSIVALSTQSIGQGGAALTQSGGAFGTLLGGLTDLFVRGNAFQGDDASWPYRGMGYGAALGVLSAGLAATQVKVAPSRVLLIDLAASLGALGGAAAASPLVFGDAPSATQNRAWLATVIGGTVAGAAVGVVLTDGPGDNRAGYANMPSAYGGIIAESVASDGERHPVIGGGVAGAW